MEQIKNLLKKESGMDFENFREIILERRVSQRAERFKFAGITDYYYYLQKRLALGDRSELEELISLLTVNETFFHRDIYQFNFLRKNIFPQIQNKNTVEILSLACATGEEPYSIAMEAAEFFGNDLRKNINITGCDIDKDALNKCSTTRYSADCRRLQNLPKQYLQKYFDYSQENGYMVKDFIKKKVRFINANITNYYFTTLYDVIFCKNVMMYFPKEVQNILINNIVKSLCFGGYFFIGATEIIEKIPENLEKIPVGNSIFRKIDSKSNDDTKQNQEKNDVVKKDSLVITERESSKKQIFYYLDIPENVDRERGVAGEYADFIKKLNVLFDIKEKKIIFNMKNTKFIDRYSIDNMIKLINILEKDGKTAAAVVGNGGLKNMLNRTDFCKKIKLASEMPEAEKLLNPENVK